MRTLSIVPLLCHLFVGENNIAHKLHTFVWCAALTLVLAVASTVLSFAKSVCYELTSYRRIYCSFDDDLPMPLTLVPNDLKLFFKDVKNGSCIALISTILVLFVIEYVTYT